tara:strand:- start:299 stop:580 length:282 start_codon:yes stop_codon:yes gene_type:complete
MSTELLKRINKDLKQRVRDIKFSEKEEERMGLFSFMLEEGNTKLIDKLDEINKEAEIERIKTAKEQKQLLQEILQETKKSSKSLAVITEDDEE